MVRDDDDNGIMDEQLTYDGMMDPYWSLPSSPASTYDWKMQKIIDLNAYFSYSSGPSSPSTDEDVKWNIEYDREIKKTSCS